MATGAGSSQVLRIDVDKPFDVDSSSSGMTPLGAADSESRRPPRVVRLSGEVVSSALDTAGVPADELALREEVERENRRDGDRHAGEDQIPLSDFAAGV